MSRGEWGMAEAYSVTAYITAYCDAEAVGHCVEAIAAQSYPIGRILIVDNSPQALELDLRPEISIRRWHHPENIGIAGGLAIAVANCIAQGDDFLWTFDQDSVADSDCLAALIDLYHQQSGPVGTVAPTVIDARTGEYVRPSRWLGDRFKGFLPDDISQPYQCDAPITSGCLVALTAAKQVPLPDPRLIIDGLDLDYGLRLQQAGYANWIAPNARLLHHFGIPKAINLLGIRKTLQLYSPFRHYYICRNHTYLELFHSKGWAKLTCIAQRLKYLLTCCFYIPLYDRQQTVTKLKACLLGTYHGLIADLEHPWR
jgi:rhamnosyltransferase